MVFLLFGLYLLIFSASAYIVLTIAQSPFPSRHIFNHSFRRFSALYPIFSHIGLIPCRSCGQRAAFGGYLIHDGIEDFTEPVAVLGRIADGPPNRHAGGFMYATLDG